MPPPWSCMTRPAAAAMVAVVVVMAAPALRADDRPGVKLRAPGVAVQSGARIAIYAFPPVGAHAPRPDAPWPYPYPPYPTTHPAFPGVPVYPSYVAAGPYVPLGSPHPAPPPDVRAFELRPGGRLVIEVEPPDAEVYVDGGRVTPGDRGYDVGLLAGRHRIDVRRTGMLPWTQDVEVPPGGGLLITVQMAEEPPGKAEPGR